MYTSMGAHRHGQEGHLPPPLSLEMLKSVFLLQMLSKTSIDVCMYVCMYIRLKQLTNRNIDNTDNKRESKR